MKLSVLSLLAGGAAAFPMVLEEINKRQLPSTGAAQALSKARTNCGVRPCLVFDGEAAKVSTTGNNAYASPLASDIRGPCPGLNAAANHGYLPRNGILNIANTITGLGTVYGMGPDLAGFLAAFAILTDGDPISGTWSIGGPLPQNPLATLFGPAEGISYSHNVYEGDSSISRADAYINNGDAHSLIVSRFLQTYKIAVDDGSDRYTLDKFVQDFSRKADESVATNPYYFAAPVSTTLVSPAAYNFVINLMSNHTADNPGGYLDGEIFKTFFAVSGDYPNFVWNRGQERIPDNWYRRTLTNTYDNNDVVEDLAVGFLAYPNTFRLGGNTNGVNTYVGVNLTDFTSGAMDTNFLFNPNGQGACFFAQVAQSVIPDLASLPLQLLTPVTNLLNNYIKPFSGGFDCPIVDKFDQSLFNKYPGRKYNPTGPDNNY